MFVHITSSCLSVVLLVTSCSGAYSPLQEPVFRSRVSVAQCRSTCLQQLLPAQTACSGPQCLACWDQCIRYTTQPEAAQLCEEKKMKTDASATACGQGCKTACGFYNNQNSIPMTRRSSRSRSQLAFSMPPSVSRCQLSWGRLGRSANSLAEGLATQRRHHHNHHRHHEQEKDVGEPLVHLILGRDRAEKWYEVNQTEATQTRIPYHTLAKLEELLVVAVGPQGVLGSARLPVVESQLVSCALDAEAPRRRGLDALFPLSLETMRQEGGLVMATVAWDYPQAAAVVASTFPASSSANAKFLVRWKQAPHGFVSGNLYTNASRVDLALVPDTQVLVEVEVLASHHGVASSQLFINTHTQVEFVMNPALVVALLSLLLSMAAVVCIVISIRHLRSKVSKHKQQQQNQRDLNSNSAANNNNKLSSLLVSSIATTPASSPFKNNLKEINIVRDKLSNIRDSSTVIRDQLSVVEDSALTEIIVKPPKF